MEKSFPGGLSPVGIVTRVVGGDVKVVMAGVTLPNGNGVVNFHLGGIYAPVDTETGVITCLGVDKSGLYMKSTRVQDVLLKVSKSPFGVRCLIW